jgi:hypothetical protein
MHMPNHPQGPTNFDGSRDQVSRSAHEILYRIPIIIAPKNDAVAEDRGTDLMLCEAVRRNKGKHAGFHFHCGQTAVFRYDILYPRLPQAGLKTQDVEERYERLLRIRGIAMNQDGFHRPSSRVRIESASHRSNSKEGTLSRVMIESRNVNSHPPTGCNQSIRN